MKDINVVINLKKQDKQRVEKKIDSYRNMNIQYWEMATILAHRMESTEECERNLLLGLTPSKHFKSTHLTQVQTTLNENRRKSEYVEREIPAFNCIQLLLLLSTNVVCYKSMPIG